jgi:hypothetical protein
MLPLTGAQMRKYMAELEKSKNPNGYVSSSSGGVSLRKLKRKDSGRGEAGVIEVEDAEGEAERNMLVSVESPISKKARTGKGVRPIGGRPPAGKDVGGTSLNDEAMESFWHSQFDIRRYVVLGFLVFTSPNF